MIAREQAARAEAQASAAQLEQDLRDRDARTARAYEAIDDLRGELDAVRAAYAAASRPAEPEPQDAIAAEPEPQDATAAEPEPSQPEPEPTIVEPASAVSPGPIDADRLEAALSRLRATAPELPAARAEPTPPAALASAGRPWIGPVFRSTVRRDPAAAGRLAVALLPAQPLVQPLPLAYDLILSDLGCVAVTAAGGTAQVELRDLPRRREEVQLQVRGELSSLARMLAAGPVRRRLRRGLARPKGDRRTLRAIRALVRAQLTLEQLRAAGVRPQPTVALALIAAMIEPEWTRGERFTVAHREPNTPAARLCLRVRDGEPVAVGDPDEGGPLTTTIVCPAATLLSAFDAASGPDASIEGDARPLTVVQDWVKRAQSG